MTTNCNISAEVRPLLDRAAAGDEAAWPELFGLFQPRLRRMVALRLDQHLQGRIDPSDVLQEAYIDAAAQLPKYLEQPTLPFFLWLRMVTGARLARVHRFHLGTQARDARRELSLDTAQLPQASSAVLANLLVGSDTRPEEAAARAERLAGLQNALNQLDETDREILALRHYEELTFAEAGLVLGLSETGAGKRYVNALSQLKDLLAQQPGGLEGFQP